MQPAFCAAATGVVELEARAGLLPGRRAAVARCRHADPQADARTRNRWTTFKRSFWAKAEIPARSSSRTTSMSWSQDLNEVVAYDWATFLHDRIDKINPHADLAGIEQGGYKLVYAGQAERLGDAPMAAMPAGRRRGRRLLVFDRHARGRRWQHRRCALEWPRGQGEPGSGRRRSLRSTGKSSRQRRCMRPSARPKGTPSRST